MKRPTDLFQLGFNLADAVSDIEPLQHVVKASGSHPRQIVQFLFGGQWFYGGLQLLLRGQWLYGNSQVAFSDQFFDDLVKMLFGEFGHGIEALIVKEA
jgi:hypothetical protein